MGKKISIKEWQMRIDVAHGAGTYTIVEVSAKRNTGHIECKDHGLYVGNYATLATGSTSCAKCKQEKYRSTKHSNSLVRLLDHIEENYKNSLKYVRGFNGTKTPCEFACKLHGAFVQKPEYVLNNKYPCPRCGQSKIGDFHVSKGQCRWERLIKAYEKDFEFSTYTDSYTPVTCLCKNHGVTFKIVPNRAIKTFELKTFVGCPSCLREQRQQQFTKTNVEVRKEIQEKHSGRIKLVDSYRGTRNLHRFKCVSCNHVWKTIPDSITRSNASGCPRCVGNISKGENELYLWIKSMFPDAQQSIRQAFSKALDRTVEWDIYIPSKQVAIEYNGLYWHSYPRRPKNYHYEKSKCSKDVGVKLFHIYEDDWTSRKSVVKKTLLYLLGKNTERTFARKLSVVHKSTLSTSRRKFFEGNHMQGSPTHGVSYALVDEHNQIKALMAFSAVQSERGNSGYSEYELIRFACNGQVVGGASRLLSAFVRDYSPSRIISYSDNDLFDGGLYKALGFDFVKHVPPDYKTVWSGMRRHKSHTRRSNLCKLLGSKFDQCKSEMQNLIENRILVLFDSGKIKWELNFL